MVIDTCVTNAWRGGPGLGGEPSGTYRQPPQTLRVNIVLGTQPYRLETELHSKSSYFARKEGSWKRKSGNHTIPCVRLWVWWWWLWTHWREGAGRAGFLLPLLFTHFLHSVGLVRHTHTFAPNSLFTLCHAALPTHISRISPNPHFSCNGLLLCPTVSALPLHSNPKTYCLNIVPLILQCVYWSINQITGWQLLMVHKCQINSPNDDD